MLEKTNALKELHMELDSAGKDMFDIDFICIGLDLSNVVGVDDPITVETLNKLDFEYDNFFGSQLLDGVVVFKDNTWLQRYNIEDTSQWVYCECPVKETVRQWIYATKDLL